MFWSGLLIVLSRLGLGSISAVLSCSVPEQRLVIEPRLGLEMLEDITFDKATLQSEDKSIQIRSDQIRSAMFYNLFHNRFRQNMQLVNDVPICPQSSP